MILIIQIWTNLTFSNLNVNFCSNYRYDTRGEDKSYEEARHWSDDKVLTGRAFFRGDHDPGRLILDNVGAKDQGVYKCRVDFRKAPTRISNVNLNVIGEKTWRKQLENLRKTFFLLTLSVIAHKIMGSNYLWKCQLKRHRWDWEKTWGKLCACFIASVRCCPQDIMGSKYMKTFVSLEFYEIFPSFESFED